MSYHNGVKISIFHRCINLKKAFTFSSKTMIYRVMSSLVFSAIPLLFCVECLKLEIVSFLPLNVPTTISLPYTGPPLRLAVKNANLKYSPHFEVSLSIILKDSDKTCFDVAASTLPMVVDYYHKNSGNSCMALVGGNVKP